MSWGYKILVVYIAFVAGILFLVFKSSSQKMDLVTTDYYAKELKFQQKIDETNRVNALSVPVLTEINGSNLIITFPPDFTGKEVTGEAVLYCPSDEDNDTRKTFNCKDEPVTMPLSSRVKKAYELHLSWTVGGSTYYLEKKITLNTKHNL